MPKVLIKQLILTLAVGIGCFFISLLLYYHQKDTILLFLGSILFLSCLGKSISNFLLIKSKKFEILEGTCTMLYHNNNLLKKYYEAVIIDKKQMEYHIKLDKKNYKIYPQLSYRFYFIPATVKEKTLSFENILAIEIL